MNRSCKITPLHPRTINSRNIVTHNLVFIFFSFGCTLFRKQHTARVLHLISQSSFILWAKGVHLSRFMALFPPSNYQFKSTLQHGVNKQENRRALKQSLYNCCKLPRTGATLLAELTCHNNLSCLTCRNELISM